MKIANYLLPPFITFFCLFFLNVSRVSAQEPFVSTEYQSRIFVYKGQKISYLACSNRIGSDLSFPGMKVCIIVGAPDQTAEALFTSDPLRNVRISGMADYACFYYLPYSKNFEEPGIKEFVKQFIGFNYDSDMFNRNKVFLIWKNKTVDLTEQTVVLLHPEVAAIGTYDEADHHDDDSLFFHIDKASISFLTANYSTSVSYNIPDMPEAEEKRRQRYVQKLGYLKKTFFFKITLGQNNIGDPNRTDHDLETLMDFSEHKMIWNIQTGYHITDRIAPFVNFGIIYSGKSKSINNIDFTSDNIVIDGSGSGGGMIRYGVGLRLIPYKRNRFSTFLDLMSGGVTVIAAGGSGTITVGSGNTTEIITKKERSRFYSLSGGFNCRLSNFFYITSNLAYDISPLKQPIGSVTSFTGLSFHAGVGFTLSF